MALRLALLKKYNAEFYKIGFSLVDCNVIDLSGNFDFSLSSQSLDKSKVTYTL